MDTIDRIVYINLDKRTDRRADAEAEFARLGITTYERFSGILIPDTCLGCLVSHYRVVRKAWEDGVTRLLVLEDDFRFQVPDRATLDARLHDALATVPQFDVLMLDYNMLKSEPLADRPDVQHIRRCLNSYVAAAYIVEGHYLETLARWLEFGYIHGIHVSGCVFDEAAQTWSAPQHSPEKVVPVDVLWFPLQQRDRWYYVKPRLSYQRPSYSDLANKYMEHNYTGE